MPYNIVIPETDCEAVSTKDIVISSLSRDWPLNIQQLYNRTKKTFLKNVTYQATYKAVRSLHDEGVLIKQGKDYSISQVWLEETKEYLNFISGLIERKEKNPKNFEESLIMNRNLQLFEFEKFKNLYKFLRKFEDNLILAKNENSSFYWVVNHCYKALFQPSLEFEYMEKLKKKGIKLHILCNGDTSLDKWCRNFYEKNGAVMKIDAGFGISRHINIYNEFIIEIFFSPEFQKIIHGVYNSASSVHAVDIAEILKEISKDDSKILVIINKNKRLVDYMKKSVLGYFDESISS
ncbi:hypothetical protein ISS05_01090 [Candidatus Woesearchaeota archaeon]|nr:hypothetical protein [Candidatus Woesearchaeota archaeon]